MVHGDLGFRRFFKRRRIKAYSRRADKTRKIQTTRYRSTALSLVDIGARSLEIIIEDFWQGCFPKNIDSIFENILMSHFDYKRT